MDYGIASEFEALGWLNLRRVEPGRYRFRFCINRPTRPGSSCEIDYGIANEFEALGSLDLRRVEPGRYRSRF